MSIESTDNSKSATNKLAAELLATREKIAVEQKRLGEKYKYGSDAYGGKTAPETPKCMGVAFSTIGFVP
jgi:hypothetical protein